MSCPVPGKPFYYRGCGWKPWRPDWSKEDQEWIKGMDTMFTRLFGPDFCEYECTKPSKASILSPGQIDHDVMDIIEVNDNTAKASASTVSSEGSCNLTTDEDDVSCSVSGDSSHNQTNDEDDVSCSVSGEGSCNQSNEEDDVSCSVSGEGSCNQTNGEDDVSCTVKKRQLTLADFQNGRLNSLTRNEATAYYLPEVSFIAQGDVTVSKHFTNLFNPLLANGRPSASTVQHAMKLQRTSPYKAVKLGHLGCYNLTLLKVFEKMCALDSDASNL